MIYLSQAACVKLHIKAKRSRALASLDRLSTPLVWDYFGLFLSEEILKNWLDGSDLDCRNGSKIWIFIVTTCSCMIVNTDCIFLFVTVRRTVEVRSNLCLGSN